MAKTSKKISIPCSEDLMREINEACDNLTEIGLTTTPTSLLQVIIAQKDSDEFEDDYRKAVSQLAKRKSKKSTKKTTLED